LRVSLVVALALLAGLVRTPARQRTTGPVVPGIDVLRQDGFASLAGRRVALLTNLAAFSADGVPTLDVVRAALGPALVALFAPEHGLTAGEDADVSSLRDPRTGLIVHSLYGSTQRPTEDMLRGLDVILIDLPDVGARFYTYMTTMAYVMEEAAKHRVAVMVLDRPNPIGGVAIEGPILDDDLRSFAGYHAMPVRHGLTLGELARLFNGERRIGAMLTVVPARGWTRDQSFERTGLTWHNPSPNIRTPVAAALYPGIGAIEWSNVSVGRGTDAPFEQIGAPWIDGGRLAAALNARRLPGVRFAETGFTPASSVFAGQRCSGVRIIVLDREALHPVRVGIEIAAALHRQHPAEFMPGKTVQLLGSRESLARLMNGEDPATIAAGWAQDEQRWRELRAKYLLY
jgi:uncharacterized protein YbbC (DUF1343 family)